MCFKDAPVWYRLSKHFFQSKKISPPFKKDNRNTIRLHGLFRAFEPYSQKKDAKTMSVFQLTDSCHPKLFAFPPMTDSVHSLLDFSTLPATLFHRPLWFSSHLPSFSFKAAFRLSFTNVCRPKFGDFTPRLLSFAYIIQCIPPPSSVWPRFPKLFFYPPFLSLPRSFSLFEILCPFTLYAFFRI